MAFNIKEGLDFFILHGNLGMDSCCVLTYIPLSLQDFIFYQITCTDVDNFPPKIP